MFPDFMLPLWRRVGQAFLPQPGPKKARRERTHFTQEPCPCCGARTAADVLRLRWYCIDEECLAAGRILILSDGPYFAWTSRRYQGGTTAVPA